MGLTYFTGLFRNQSSLKELALLDKIKEGFLCKFFLKKAGMDLHSIKNTLFGETKDFLG